MADNTYRFKKTITTEVTLRPSQVRKLLAKALDLPENAEINFHLGTLYNGPMDEAGSTVVESVSLVYTNIE